MELQFELKTIEQKFNNLQLAVRFKRITHQGNLFFSRIKVFSVMVVLTVRGFRAHAQTQNKVEEKCSLKLHARKLLHNRCEIKKFVPHLMCLCLTDSTLAIAKKHYPIWDFSRCSFHILSMSV